MSPNYTPVLQEQCCCRCRRGRERWEGGRKEEEEEEEEGRKVLRSLRGCARRTRPLTRRKREMECAADHPTDRGGERAEPGATTSSSVRVAVGRSTVGRREGGRGGGGGAGEQRSLLYLMLRGSLHHRNLRPRPRPRLRGCHRDTYSSERGGRRNEGERVTDRPTDRPRRVEFKLFLTCSIRHNLLPAVYLSVAFFVPPSLPPSRGHPPTIHRCGAAPFADRSC